MKIFGEFGIEPLLLLAQIVNFTILLLLLRKFLYKPVLTVLKKREEKIREGLKAGEQGELLLAKAQEEQKEILAKAAEESNFLLKETKDQVLRIEEEALHKAKEESEVILLRAREQIGQEKTQTMKELEKRVANVAIDMLGRLLPKVLTKEDHMRIIASSEKLLRKAVA